MSIPIINTAYYKENFEKIFSNFYKSLCLFANSYVKNMTLAEDIVEDAFMKLWEAQTNIRHEAAMYKWLCTTVRNKSLNEIRAGKRVDAKKDNFLQVMPAQDNDNHLERMLQAELVTQIHTFIFSLPPQCSKVLAKLYIDDKSMVEASRELGLSVNSIKSHKARGLTLLRRKLLPVIIFLFTL